MTRPFSVFRTAFPKRGVFGVSQSAADQQTPLLRLRSSHSQQTVRVRLRRPAAAVRRLDLGQPPRLPPPGPKSTFGPLSSLRLSLSVSGCRRRETTQTLQKVANPSLGKHVLQEVINSGAGTPHTHLFRCESGIFEPPSLQLQLTLCLFDPQEPSASAPTSET